MFLGTYVLATIVMLYWGNTQGITLWLLFLFASIPCLLLLKLLCTNTWGRQTIGNLLLLGVIIFATWKIFVPDSDVTTLKNKSEIDVFGLYYRNFINIICFKYKTFHDSSLPFVPRNFTAFVVSLGVFIYTAFLCTTIKSWVRWILYIIAGIAVLVTGISYYQNSAPAVQSALFLLFVIVWCSFFSLIKNSKEKEYPEVPEQLGRIRAYNRFHAWIRRSLKEGGGKAALLLGGWGIGKTHCLKYLSHRLSLKQPYNDGGIKGRYDKRQYDDDFDKDNAFMGKVKICMVNLWEYSSREEAWNAIVQALGRTILGRYSFLNSITLNKYLPRIMRSLPGGNIFSNLYELFFGGDSDRDEALCEQLSDDIGCNERIVLILDDIERTDFQIIKALPPLIEKLHKIKKLMVICSLAKDELAKVHKKELNAEDSEELALETLTGYLTKIFGYTFSLPNLSMYKRNTYIDERLRKYSDCKLTCRYLKQSGLNFDTPRQIERAIDELGELERQFFYDVDSEKLSNEEIISWYYAGHSSLYKYYSCTVFLVEMIQIFYPQFFSIAQSAPEDLVKFAQRVNHMVEISKKQGQGWEELQEGKKKESKEIQYICKLIRTDHFAADLIKALGDCKEENVQRAIEGEYKRRHVSTTRECERLYTVLNKDPQMTLLDGFKKIFGGEGAIPEDLDASGLEFFEYVMKRVTNVTDDRTDYAKLLLKLIPQGGFERDEENSDRVIFKWTIKHFLHLSHIYIKYAPDSKFVERAVLEMFSRASVSEKAFVLKEFYKGDDKKEPKEEVVYEFDDRLYSLSLKEINDVIMKLHPEYVKHIISNLLDCKIQAEEIVDRLYFGYHFYDLVKNEFAIEVPHISIPEGTRDEGLINLIDFVTLRSGFGEGYDGEQMATSKRKSTLFLPTLRVWFDSHSVSLLLSAKIDRWIEKCEASISYWKDDKTGLNTLRKYTVGAEEVKKFLEDLKAKKESPVENEEEKTSE